MPAPVAPFTSVPPNMPPNDATVVEELDSPALDPLQQLLKQQVLSPASPWLPSLNTAVLQHYASLHAQGAGW